MQKFLVQDGDSFRAWRAISGWTQAETAERFNVSRNTIQNWESGMSEIPRAVGAMCDLWTREIKKADASYGPVVLIYADARIMRAMYSNDPIATLRSETFATMGDALRRVDELWGTERFHNPLINDENETLWNMNELATRAARTRTSRRGR